MLATETDRCGIASYTDVLSEGLAAANIDVVRVSLDAERRARDTYVDEVRRDIARIRPDVVHIQHEYSFFGGLIQPFDRFGAAVLGMFRRLRLAHLAPSHYFEIIQHLAVPLVVTLHELIDTAPAPGRGVRGSVHHALVRESTRATFAGANAVITHSEERRERLLELGLDPARVHVIPLAIPQASVLPDRTTARQHLDVVSEVVVLTAGFLSPRKGVDHLIRALASLPERVILVVVGESHGSGDSGHRAELERLAANLGISARVRFTGYLEHPALAAWLAAADIYAVTPLEMGGASASLAMGISAGLPIVAWAHPFMGALQEQHRCLELVPFLDDEALARALATLIENPPAAALLRVQSEAARDAGTPAHEGRRTRDVYERVSLEQRRHPATPRMTLGRAVRVCAPDVGNALRARRSP